jgi:hypothetical protein
MNMRFYTYLISGKAISLIVFAAFIFLMQNLGCKQKPKNNPQNSNDHKLPDSLAHNKKNTAAKYNDTGIKRSFYATDSKEGLLIASKEGKYGYVNLKGETVIPFIYDWGAAEFSEGLAAVGSKGKVGFISPGGDTVIPFIYEHAINFSEGLAVFSVNKKYGYINKKGEIKIAPEYDLAFDFSCGLGQVRRKNKAGFIDSTGRIAIPIIYESALTFSKKSRIGNVKIKGKWRRIAPNGELIDI